MIATKWLSDSSVEYSKFVFGRGSARDPVGELTAFPRPPSWFNGPYF